MEDLQKKVAERILICQSSNWSANDARTIVKCALMELGVSVVPEDFRRLVACAYRVGKAIDRSEAPQPVPWKIDEVRLALRSSASFCDEEKFSDSFIKELAGVVRGCRFDKPYRIDWIEMIARIFRRTDRDKLMPSLEERAAAQEVIDGVISSRLSSLANNAAVNLELSPDDVLAAFNLASQEYVASGGNIKASNPDSRVHKQSLCSSDIDRLLDLVVEPKRSEFRQWINTLSATCQQAINRRILQLNLDPVTNRMWVKRILDRQVNGLFECKVMSAGTHFRILYRRTSSEEINILSFGLRRDLSSLVEEAKKFI
jgi:hypothetical protein